MKRSWAIRPRAPQSHFEQVPELPWPIAQALYHRGLRDADAISDFLARRADGTNPFRLLGMRGAVERIRRAIRDDEWIMVHGDFDADGVTSTTVMVTGLLALGARRVSPYIPHRVDEGYGLNGPAIEKMAERGVNLLVTVDCGIRAHAEIALAVERGMDVIVTDHHSPAATLPEALAIVNPHQPDCPYPHKMLAGVGLAWKTIQALALAEQRQPLTEKQVDLEALLDLVAVGTVADVAPLRGENRALVTRGLDVLRHTTRPGLKALLDSAHVRTEQPLTTEAIGFFLGPRINAAGRLDSAMDAYKLLRAPSAELAEPLAAELEEKNRRRQGLTEDALRRAEAQVGDEAGALLFVSDPDCPEGIVGLVAGRLTERFYRPTIVISQGDAHSRASCRSIPEFHITRALDQVAGLLERHGGHAAAAGFTVLTDRLDELQAALEAVADAELGDRLATLRPRLVGDAELPLSEVTPALVDALEQLAPFGAENEEPLWMCRRVAIRGARTVGGTGQHLRLTLQASPTQLIDAIAFRQGSRLDEALNAGIVDLAYTIKRSMWKDKPRIELQVADFRAAQS